MQKIRQFSTSFVFVSVLYIAIGLILLFGPTLSMTAVDYGLGVLMIVLGITYGIVYFVGDKKQEGFLQADLVIGIVCIAFGIFVLLTPNFVETILPLAIAVLLLVGAIVKIQNSLSMRRLMIRRWYLGIIAAVIVIALGILLLIDPMKMTEAQRFIYIGICLILDGTTNLVGLICIRFRSRKIEKIQQKDPDADIRQLYLTEWQKSDEAKAEKKAARKAQKEKNDSEIVVDAAEVVEAPEVPEETAAQGNPEEEVPKEEPAAENSEEEEEKAPEEEPSGAEKEEDSKSAGPDDES